MTRFVFALGCILTGWGMFQPAVVSCTAADAEEGVTEEMPVDQLKRAAIDAYRDQDFAGAVVIYEKLAAADPDNDQHRKDLMWVYWEMERYDACLQQARTLLAADGQNLEAMNMAATALHRMEEHEQAREAYEQILKRDESARPATRLAHAQVLEALREYELARHELRALAEDHPELGHVQVSLGRVLHNLGRNAEAAEAWGKAAEQEPDRVDYRYAEAESLFLSGRGTEAVRRMVSLLKRWPDHGRARDFLLRYAMVRGDLERATELMVRGPRPPGDAAAPFLVRLAGMYMRLGRDDRALSCLDEALAALPGYGEALLLKAELLRQAGRQQEAATLFEQVVEANDWSVRGWVGLADARMAGGDVQGALSAVRSARTADPTNPGLLTREAQYLYHVGDTEGARTMLDSWLAANREPPLVVLLYHGLTKRADDPLLASRVHMRTERFEEQVKALAEAGYQSVTGDKVAQWYAGDGSLPEKAVWVVFDDGRLDSFRESTPVLKRYGMTAAMFVAGHNADRNLPGYATWEELLAYREGGVWEMQSHGDLASVRDRVSEDGRTGLYVPNRFWAEEEGRLETQAEWKQRVADEYAGGKSKMEERLGQAPLALAWPEGNFGQEGIPTAEGAAAYNIEQTRSHYTLAFHQDGYGQNVRTSDPMMLRRLEPNPDWSGEELVRHLADHAPAVRVLRQLLETSIAERDAVSARRSLDALSETRLSKVELLGERVRVLYLEEEYPKVVSAATELLGLLKAEGPTTRAFLSVLNTLGYALQRSGDIDRALEVFVGSLRKDPDQAQIWLAAAHAAEQQRSYASALRALEQAGAREPDVKHFNAMRARLLDHLGRNAEAAEAWGKAAEQEPDRVDYRYAEAESLFLSGRGTEAVRRMVSLLKRWPDHGRARDFLLRYAMVRGDLERATELMVRGPRPPGDAAAPFLVRLAGMYMRQDGDDRALSCLDEALAALPGYGEALLLKAELLRQAGREQEAASLFEQVVEANGWSVRGWVGLADARMAGGDVQGALSAVRSARTADPTNPGFLTREAQYLYHAGDAEGARTMLDSWLAANREPPLVVLLYHGLTKRADDPLLASRVHMRTERFEEQVKALAEAGYQSVTGDEVAQWYAGNGSLPEKAVWVVFDDGRLDSFRESTPVLKRYGMTAAMFVAGHNADRNLPGYATWEELLAYREGGVWEMQSHGDLASVRDRVSEDGRTGLYVPNRFWVEEEGRLETQAEWKQRVADEYAGGKSKMEERLGQAPLALAWPEGNFGQEGIPTAEGAAAYNMEQTRSHYALAFHQDGYGQNVRTRDPMMLRRLEPNPDWSGKELVRHLADHAPAVRVLAELLKQATWEGRIRSAHEHLSAIEALGVSPGTSLQYEALIHSAAGDQSKALDRALSAAEETSIEEVEPVLRTIHRRNRQRVETSVRYREDGDGRSSWAADGEYRSSQMGRVRLQTGLRVADHREDGFQSISEWSPYMGVALVGNLEQQVDLLVRGYVFDGGPSDQVGGVGSWQAGWSDHLWTYATVERAPVYTVQALSLDIMSDRVLGSVVWSPDAFWQSTARAGFASYSDGNERASGSLELSRSVDAVEGLALSGLLSYDDTSQEAVEYYTPQGLLMLRLGISYETGEAQDRIQMRLRYLPGYGIEDEQDSRFVHAGSVDLSWRIRPGLTLRPVIHARHTPTYRSAGGRLSLQLDF